MTREEAIARIIDHMIVHHMEEPGAVKITEALSMAVEALRKLDSIEKIVEQHDADKMAENYFYLDQIREGIEKSDEPIEIEAYKKLHGRGGTE